MVDHVGMRCRSKGLLKKTNYNLSPFMERSVSTTKRLNKKEKALALFGMYNQKEDNVKVMFQYDNTILQRMHMATLCRDNVVSPEVITAWVICLNMNEEFRSDASPTRFFASVEICSESIVQPPSTWTYNRRRDIFFRLLSNELSGLQQMAVSGIDLFCFPVYRIMNFFMVCVDIRKEKAYVLDSRNETQVQCRDEKYLSTVNDVKQMLGDYMGHLGHVHKSNSPKLKKQLNLLRARYCAVLLGWEKNIAKDAVAVGANAYYDEVFNNPALDIDATLLG
ncbi:uncharacterized protein LOC131002641 [Salvia miltiorrhiza]|uniref:uncharacterized protein LOC131002641 n=1 Tax=Salvia miltiorrhiza TaxID=226208 RepID=UPI0025AD64D7|nr:uncharacterized protein LOC131002641 [Salvia miltiorrhiza]